MTTTTTKVPRSRQRKSERETRPAAQDCTATLDGRDAWAYDELKHEADVFRSMLCQAREVEHVSWNELSKRTGIPAWALQVLCRETAGRRPSRDRQSEW